MLIGRALGDLLQNSLMNRANTVRITGGINENFIELIVEDDGPGFSPAVLDDTSKSLHRLRNDLRRSGGDLVIGDSNRLPGAQVRFRLPLTTATLRPR